VLLRDGAAGLETFLLKRGSAAAFVPGAHVFPGGALEAADTDPEVYACCDGLGDAAASERLEVPRDGLAYWVAAIRESFEEAGVLLAVDQAGAEPDWRDPALRTRLTEGRRALNAGETTLGQILAAERLRLPVARLRYYGHWVTPPGPPRRYSTRFFAARAPAGQDLTHDGVETVAGAWTTPGHALRCYRRGELSMILPTEMQLQLLRRFQDSETLLAEFDAMKRIPKVAPESVPG
jgi:8-oxo-dGTP pyrophosphatase MutT (NUDIX family)